MPATCFCGCGRPLRFGKKRASGHGAVVRRQRAILEVFVVPAATAQGTPQQQQQLARLLEDGQTLEGVFRDIAHGIPVAPPPIASVSGWFRDAKRVAGPFAQVPYDELPPRTPASRAGQPDAPTD